MTYSVASEIKSEEAF